MVRFGTLVSAFAPALIHPDQIKDLYVLYEDLNAVIATTPNADKLIILDYSNARFGCDCGTWEVVIGKHGVDNCNSNSLLRL